MYTNSCVLQGIYTQYRSDHQTKYLSICFALQFVKVNVRQMYRVYSKRYKLDDAIQ